MIDCEILSKVYINLFDQKEPTLDFSIESKNGKNLFEKKTVDYFKKVIISSSEELKAHKEYLKKSLKKNNY